MRLKFVAATAFLAMTTLYGQGPLYDKVYVNLPYPVKIDKVTLDPGAYEIRQLPSAAKSYVLLIYKDGGMKHETSVMTIPTLDNKTPEDTTVLLHHIGNDYYFDKIWIQGKNYGYEFVLPDDVKSRMKEMESSTVKARYEAVPDQSKLEPTPQAAPPAETPKTDTSAADQERQAQAERDRLAQEEKDRLERERVAQAEKDRLAQEEQDRAAQAERDRQAQAERDRLAQAEHDRLAAQQPAPAETPSELPGTSAGWLQLLIAGGALSGIGLRMLRS